jgi:exopolysaccharide biosynthesis WecB/TagA/CpsF family protein
MGMPKQEAVAARLANSGVPCLIVCGGAILDFLGGKVSRAPQWMRRLGCEWVFRLISEPKRLFTRYVVGNPMFLLRTLIFRERTAAT